MVDLARSRLIDVILLIFSLVLVIAWFVYNCKVGEILTELGKDVQEKQG
jgi:hypothetical protein